MRLSLAKKGWLVTNTKPFVNIPNYPDLDKVTDAIRALPRKIIIDADELAKEAGSPKAMNMVMLGAASPFLDVDYEKLQAGIQFIFGRKGEKIVTLNLKALEAGRAFAQGHSTGR